MSRINALRLSVLFSVVCLLHAAASCEAGMLLSSVHGVANAPEDSLGGSDFLFKVDTVTTGVLDLSDFTFYIQAADGSALGSISYTWLDSNNPGQNFGSYFFAPVTNAADVKDETIAGFIYNGTADIDTYLIKAGTNYSVWKYESGFNLAFYDVDGNEGGPPWQPTGLPGNDGARGISHINFYGSLASTQPVPEPSSLLLFGLGAVVAGGLEYRRRWSK